MVSTWGIRGHFETGSDREAGTATAAGGGREAAHRRGDACGRGLGGARGAGVWGKRQPSVWLAHAVWASAAWPGEGGDGELASGACDRRVGYRTGVVERRAGTPNRVGHNAH